jgi:diguanylate cyclase (GGDEF)-like protein/hemerythrin-like metal-binding protein
MHVPTMFMMIIFACVSLALSVGWAAWNDDRDGLRTWAVALCAHAIGYGLLALRGTIPDVLSVVVANAMISASYSFLLMAVLKIQERRVPPLPLWAPPLVLAIAFAFLMDSIQKRIVVGNIILLAQAVMVGHRLVQHRYDFPVRGRNLAVFGMVVASIVTVARVVVAVLRPQDVAAIFQISTVQVVTYFSAFMSLILVSNGLVLMAKERSDQSLRTVAMKDRLTGCWNRIRIEEVAQQEIARLKRYGYPAALIMLDLDHFKAINDRHGHAAGDAILRGFAEIMRGIIRTTDVVGRWGGEEFIVVLPSSGFSEAVRMAERIRASLEARVFPGGYRATVSLGVAACRSSDNWEEWLGRADGALYRAKAAGRNQVKAEDLEIGADDLASDGARIIQLRWRPGFESGNETIDAQHRALFAQANALLAQGADPADHNGIADQVSRFWLETRKHLVDEEIVIRHYGYPQADDHARAHAQLIERFDELFGKFTKEKIGAGEIFHFIVYELTAQHILIEDRKFFPLFRQRAPDTPGAA